MADTVLDLSQLMPKKVRVVGPDGKEYLLRSPSAGAAIEYQEHLVSLNEGKGRVGIVRANPFLVSLCLSPADAPDTRVAVETLEGWDQSAFDKLLRWVKSMCPEILSFGSDPDKTDEENGGPKGRPADGTASSS